jgi:alkanesulfonate monooxygenase SsuD/methylene tetrahydromethanopterin reductase-like flavin-dependent oxidoreductase (luciferase family)
MELQFGVFDHVERGHRSIQEVFRHRLNLVERFDKAGFYGYHVSEHHSTTLSCAPSPNVFLAAVSQRTSRIKLAPLVYILPMYNPLRLIEEVCMLDQMSGGRLEMGVGKGIAPFELVTWKIDPNESLDIYKEALDVLLAGLQTKSLTYKGHYFRYVNTPLELEPLQKPYPPLWYGVFLDPAATIWPAKMNANLATIVQSAKVRPIVERFKEEWDKAHGGTGKTRPKIALQRTIIVAETDEQANRIGRRAHECFQHELGHLWHRYGAKPAHFPPTWEGVLEWEMVIAGSPATVRAELERQAETSAVNYVTARFCYGDMTDQEVDQSVSLFIDEIMPHFTAKSALRAAS